LFDSLASRGLLPLSGVILTLAFSKSTSVHLSLLTSPDLAAVSLQICRNKAIYFVDAATRSSISRSVGMKGSFSGNEIRGSVNSIFAHLAKRVLTC